MRIAYLDEAGISNPAHEPYLVVAGIILHADEHWRPLEEHLRAIGRRYLPNETKPLFHAKDIFHGTGLFDRGSNWPRERRWHLLSELCEIPRTFELPIVFGFHNRQRHRDDILKQWPDSSPAQSNLLTHADTFVKAAIGIESWMRLSANRSESVMMIAEDTPKVKRIIKKIHSDYTNRFMKVGDNLKVFNSNHIVDTVHFAAKEDSMPLQVADVCAFIIKRHLMEKDDSISFFDVMRPQIVFHEEQKLWMARSY